MASSLVSVAATGVIVAYPCFLRSVTLQGGSANSTVVVNDSTDGSGTNTLKLGAVIADTVFWQSPDDDGVWCKKGIYVTLGGTGAAVTVEFS